MQVSRCTPNMYWLSKLTLCAMSESGLSLTLVLIYITSIYAARGILNVNAHLLFLNIPCDLLSSAYLSIYIFDAMSSHRIFPQRVGHSRSVSSFSVFGTPFSTHCSSPTIFYCFKTCPLISLVIFPWFPLPFYIYCLRKVVTLLAVLLRLLCFTHSTTPHPFYCFTFTKPLIGT